MVGAIRKYSDLLLIFLLKAAAPATYRDNYHDHRHLHAHEHRHGLTPAEQQKIKRNDKIIAQLEAREKPEQHRPPQHAELRPDPACLAWHRREVFQEGPRDLLHE